jgi:hypothetical protein
MKKWFMLQVWRIQQVAAILTMCLLALNLALQMYNFVDWRQGIFETPYSGVPIFILMIFAIIWGFSIIWDLKMKMWREQMAVTVERNPYAKEKLYAKEVAIMAFFQVPLLEYIGNKDPEMKHYSEAFKNWLDNVMKDDVALKEELDSLLKYIGMESIEDRGAKK